MAISLDPEGRRWKDSSYKLAFPQLSLDVELGPGDLIFFPSKLLIHYNTPAAADGSDPKRASIVFFTHESLFRTLDEEHVQLQMSSRLSKKAKSKLSTLRRGWEYVFRMDPDNVMKGSDLTEAIYSSKAERRKNYRKNLKLMKKAKASVEG